MRMSWPYAGVVAEKSFPSWNAAGAPARLTSNRPPAPNRKGLDFIRQLQRDFSQRIALCLLAGRTPQRRVQTPRRFGYRCRHCGTVNSYSVFLVMWRSAPPPAQAAARPWSTSDQASCWAKQSRFASSVSTKCFDTGSAIPAGPQNLRYLDASATMLRFRQFPRKCDSWP